MSSLSRVEVAMQNLMDIFYQYANGDTYTLTKNQMKVLVDTEMSVLTKNKKNVEYFDKLMRDLDFDGDGKLNFEEYLSFISGITISCNEIWMQKEQQIAQSCKK
ncbi:protein S100-B-like [Narcine bancroftii]|uniref:protein S100-B-like n=1 Tax=Narcine bancroftii TaxID=1343680 RepID=UPI003831DA23